MTKYVTLKLLCGETVKVAQPKGGEVSNYIKSAPATPRLLKKDLPLLKRIRKLVEETHWMKGGYKGKDYSQYPPKVKHCLVGFVNEATGLSTYDHSGSHRGVATTSTAAKQRDRLLTAIEWAIKKRRPNLRAGSIEEFNDMAGTKRKDVLDVLDLAIEEGSK